MSTTYSISAAARIIDKSRATVSRNMKSGKLTYTLDRDGNKVVDASELLRVYGDEGCDFDRSQTSSKTVRSESMAQATVGFGKLEEQYLARIKTMEKQNEKLEEIVDKQIETYAQSLKLLEDRSSKTDDWKTALQEMEKNLLNQSQRKLSEIEERHKKHVVRLRQELEAERKKPFFKRLLGQG